VVPDLVFTVCSVGTTPTTPGQGGHEEAEEAPLAPLDLVWFGGPGHHILHLLEELVQINPRMAYLVLVVLVSLMGGGQVTGGKRTTRQQEATRPPGHPGNCSAEGGRDTFLWRIDTKPPSYFFGTIHVPYTRVWDAVSANTKKAFKAADKVYFELDLTNPYTIAALTSCQLLPRGLNLSQVLPPDVYSRLKEHLAWVKEQMAGWVTEEQAGRGLHPQVLRAASLASPSPTPPPL